jgi:quercetin dioxygenase-like cupin family protein
MQATETSAVTRELPPAPPDATIKAKQRAAWAIGPDFSIDGDRFIKKSRFILGLALVAAFTATAHAADEGVFINTGDLKWGDAPPVLPRGAKIAVLNGDPFKPGQYTLRLSLPANYRLPPHWHTLNENLTIVSGTFYVGMGDKTTGHAHEVRTGGYHYLPAKQHHYAFTKSAAVVQVSGEGPFDINYIDPKDNPAGAK